MINPYPQLGKNNNKQFSPLDAHSNALTWSLHRKITAHVYDEAAAVSEFC